MAAPAHCTKIPDIAQYTTHVAWCSTQYTRLHTTRCAVSMPTHCTKIEQYTTQHTKQRTTQCTIHKTGYYTMCSQYTGWPQVYYTGWAQVYYTGWPLVYNTGPGWSQVYFTMCSQYAGWPPLTPAISSVCHSAVTPSPLHSFLVGTPIGWNTQWRKAK